MKSLTEKHDEIYQEALDKIVELEEDYRQAVLAQPKQLAAQAIRDFIADRKIGGVIGNEAEAYIADKLEQE